MRQSPKNAEHFDQHGINFSLLSYSLRYRLHNKSYEFKIESSKSTVETDLAQIEYLSKSMNGYFSWE